MRNGFTFESINTGDMFSNAKTDMNITINKDFTEDIINRLPLNTIMIVAK